MIKVEYISDNSNPNKAIVRNVGFQLLIRRHQKKHTLRKVSREIGFPINEIDDVELGRIHAKMDVVLALCCFYGQMIDMENVRKAYQLE